MALPPSSPRLPSPPPAAEIQIGPNSPANSGASLAEQQMEQQMEQTVLDANAKRRIHPGTGATDFAVGPPLVPLNELDSAFQLQEHLAALHYFHTANNTQPISRDTARLLAQAPPGTDRTLWLYELCRFLIAQCNSLIVGFLFDTPPCSAATCPEMRASEWQFLCAVHEQPKSCCAIDYCCHTLDWAANVVTNPKIFPSRFVFADPHDKSAAVKNLINVFRRLHRIFAHAWFQHRGVFWSVEGQTGLYVLFKTVCDMYDLLPAENYKLPPEAEGLDTASSSASAGAANGTSLSDSSSSNVPGLIPLSSLADRKSMGYSPSPGPIPMATATSRRLDLGGSGGIGIGIGIGSNDDDHKQPVGRTNTRRHIRANPSVGSAVSTVPEQDEEGAAGGGQGHGRNSSSSSNRSQHPVSFLSSNSSALHAASPPSVTVREQAGHDDDDDDDDDKARGDDSDEADVPVIVQSDTSDWTPAASVVAAEEAASPPPDSSDNGSTEPQTAIEAKPAPTPISAAPAEEEEEEEEEETTADDDDKNHASEAAEDKPAEASDDKDGKAGEAETTKAASATAVFDFATLDDVTTPVAPTSSGSSSED